MVAEKGIVAKNLLWFLCSFSKMYYYMQKIRAFLLTLLTFDAIKIGAILDGIIGGTCD